MEQHAGDIRHVYRRISVATVHLDRPLHVGDRVHVKGAHDDVWFRVKSMEIDHRRVNHAGAGDDVGILVPGPVHRGSEVLVGDEETDLGW